MTQHVEIVPRRRATVAIVGRPNVGKSTLFNRLIGRRQAIVHNLPGVTRDRIFGTRELSEGTPVEFIDTGGLVPGDDPLGLNAQVLLAVEESDLLLFLVDAGNGLVPADEEVMSELRRFGKRTVVVANKADLNESEHRVHEFYGLGGEEVLLISAEHGTGIDRLLEVLEASVPPSQEVVVDATAPPAVAIVGRPNVGKSSILNRLIRDERSLVGPVAGTTRDPVDTLVRWNDRDFLLIDTAGIRRRSQVSGVAEGLAVMMARRQIERSQVAILVIDAGAGITSGDLAIAGSIWELGRCCVVAVNKWDQIDSEGREHLDEGWERLSGILAGPPRVNTSALSGRGVGRILPRVVEVLDDFHRQVSTAALNEMIRRALERHHMPTYRGRPWKVFYASQVSTGPPTFMLFANRTLPVSSTFRRYLENTFRRELGLPGVPIRLVIRKRSDS